MARNLFAIGEKIEFTEDVTLGSQFIQELQLWDDFDYMQLEADAYAGKASIIWNGYLRNLFREGYAPVSQVREAFRWDKNVCHRIEVDADGDPKNVVWVTRGRLLPANGIGRMFEITPKFYEGFPLDLVFCIKAGTTAAQSLAQTTIALDRQTSYIINDERAEVVSVEANGSSDIRLTYMLNGRVQIDGWFGGDAITVVPDNPFYIRWIGRLGGYEHMMLSCKQKHALSLDKLTTYERVEDAGVQHFSEAETTHKVSASTGAVSRETLEKIASILYSPYIQYYDTERKEWVTIQLVKGQKINWTTHQSIGEIEFTFELPNEVYTH